MLHSAFDTTRVVCKREIGGIPHEVCAEAVATPDPGGQTVKIELRAFLRSEEQTHLGETLVPEWLPKPQTVVEGAEPAEMHKVVADVFASWCRRVEEALPE